jgi:DNA-binding GntR family transcriptional regulator
MGDSLKNLDLLAFSRGNREFHACIYERCPNTFLVEQLRTIQAHLDAIQGTVFTRVPERGRSSIEEHAEIIRAIEKRAPFDEIERVAREHKMNTVRAARQHLDRGAALSDTEDLAEIRPT